MILAVEVERTEAGRLRDRLAEIEAEQATLEAELAVFHAEYVRRVLTVLAQVQDLEARILAARAERSGEASDAEAARSARSQARRSTADVRAVPATPAPPVPTGDLKRLFREAAKRMHPDLAPDADARGHAEAFMKRLNDAYRAGDGEAIADLMRQWAASPYGDGADADDDRSGGAARVAGLHGAVARAQARLDEVRNSDLAHLMEETMAAAAAGRDHLAELRARAEAALATAQARLAQT
jgi:hypothetical protein